MSTTDKNAFGEKADTECSHVVHPEDDEETFGFDMEDVPTEFLHKVLSPDEVAEQMNSVIEEVRTITELPSLAAVRLLLSNFQWDKVKLLEKYFEDDGKLLFQLGLDLSTQPQHSSPLTKNADRVVGSDCEICCRPLELHSTFGVSCGHQYCVTCWKGYFKQKIMVDGQAESIRCPAFNCSTLVEDDSILKIVGYHSISNAFRKLICNKFVQQNKLMKWCPGPRCSNAILAEYSTIACVACTCGFKFCFQCGHEWHEPISCHLLGKLMAKCSGEFGNTDMVTYGVCLIPNTKRCPKCQVFIEKNQGCRHMKCLQCGLEFCWICLKDLKLHRNGSLCKSRRVEDKFLVGLEEHPYHLDRCCYHLRKKKWETHFRAEAYVKADELNKLGTRWTELPIFTKAVEVLLECRQNLAYTYAFAHYFDPSYNTNRSNNKLELFKISLCDLEKATEELAGHLKSVMSACDVDEISTSNVVRNCRICRSRRDALLKLAREGCDEHWWSLKDDN